MTAKDLRKLLENVPDNAKVKFLKTTVVDEGGGFLCNSTEVVDAVAELSCGDVVFSEE